MLSFLGRPCPPLPCDGAAVPFVSLASLPISGVQSVFHAAVLGDIGLIQLWTNSGERIRIDEKHPVTGTASLPAMSMQLLLQLVMVSAGGTMLHYAAANGHEACVAWLLKQGCKVSPSPSASLFVISFVLQISARDRIGCSAYTLCHSHAPHPLLTRPLQPQPIS